MKRYSQYDEQEHILRIFAGQPAGRFLDVGAYNPFEFSNTRALYELGWSGVMVEPAPGPMSSLVKEYGNDPRITLIQGLARMPGGADLKRMRVTDDCVSTTEEREYERWRRQAQFLGSVLIPTFPLIDVILALGPFEFVNLDTEGTSADLFQHALEHLKWCPRCWCVEFDNRKHDIELAAANAGYSAVYSNETNIVFVRQG